MKLLARMVLIFFICSVLLGVVGITKYPNAPIKPNGMGYFDKKNNSYTEEEYEYFKFWEYSLLAVGLLTSITAIGYHVANKIKKIPNQ